MPVIKAFPTAAIANDASSAAQSTVRHIRYAAPLSDEAVFFQAWLSQPAVIGAIMPTRSALARAIAHVVGSNRPVLELGGGTGPITQALVDSGIHATQLTVIERNPVFHRMLTDRFPSLRILCGNAEGLYEILSPAEIGQVGAIVSSLPRVGWPVSSQRSILEQSFSVLREDGAFLEFSYGPFSPVPRQLVSELGLTAQRLRRVWGNFPPATIWEYRRRDRDAPRHDAPEGNCLPRIN